MFGKVAARIVAVGLLACLITGCGEAPPRVVTQVVTVTRDRYVRIPKPLTRHCDIAPPGPLVEDAVKVARERKASLEGCNARLDQIDAIQGTPVEH